MTPAITALTKKKIVLTLFGCVSVLFVAYIYFLSASVLHVVVRTETEYSMRQLRSDITKLESEFIAAQHTVSQQIASLDGYEDITQKVFIDRGESSLVMSSNISR